MFPARLVLVAVLATTCQIASAQTSAVPPALVVQQLAPQLVPFAGSPQNFQSLVNGLSQGSTVQLSTPLPNGFVQTVNFTPASAMAPAQIAQVLESARQQLISLGIAAPSAEQLGFTLMGGVVPTAMGGQQVAGVLNPPSFNPANPPSPAAQLQQQQQQNAVGGATTSPSPVTPSTPGVTNAVNVQLTPGPAVTSAADVQPPRRFTSDSTIPPGATSRSPTPPTPSANPQPAAPVSPGAGASPPTPERARQGPTRFGH